MLVKTSSKGKADIMKNRFGVTYKAMDVYANHDLTKIQQQKRTGVLPTLKKLRQAGIKCSLPLTEILLDGEVMSDSAIATALSSQ